MAVNASAALVAYGFSQPLIATPPGSILSSVDPTPQDRAQPTTIWINKTTRTPFMLVSVANNLSNWEALGSSGAVNSFKTDDGHTEVPLNGVITLQGDGVNTVTSGSGSTVQISLVETVKFSAYQSGMTGGIAGDGVTVYSLGSSSSFTSYFNVGEAFYGGDGISTPALFTAPSDGYYFLTIAILWDTTGAGGDIYSSSIVGPVYTITSTGGPDVSSGNPQYQSVSGFFNLTAGQEVTFTVTGSAHDGMNSYELDNPGTYIQGFQVL